MNKTTRYYYLNRNGEKDGPYLADDIHRMLEQKKIHPTSEACTDGIPGWVPLMQIIHIPMSLGEIQGIADPKAKKEADKEAKRREKAKEKEKSRKAPAADNAEEVPSTLPGIGRFAYIVVPVIFALLYFLAAEFLLIDQQANPEPLLLVAYVLYFLLFGLIWPILRLRNIGKSAWNVLLFFIPIINIYPSVLCLIAPPGYRYHKKMDAIGIVLFLLAILPFVALIALFFISGAWREIDWNNLQNSSVDWENLKNSGSQLREIFSSGSLGGENLTDAVPPQ